MALIDDFEDGGTDTNQYWDNWPNAVSNVSTSNLEGSRAGEITSSGFHRITRSSADYQPDTIEFWHRPVSNSSSNNETGIILSSDGTFDYMFQAVFNDGSSLFLVGPSIGTGGWSYNTTYRFTLTNVDYGSNTFDLVIYDETNNTTHYSGSGISFADSVSGFGLIEHQIDDGFTVQIDAFNAIESLNGPSNLSVTSTTSSSVDLSWTDNDSSEGGFYVYRDTSSSVATTSGNRIATLSSNTTTYSDTSVSAGTTYYYVVSAYNTDVEETTNEVSTTTPLPAPSNVSVTDSTTEGELTIDWDSVNGTSGYYVYRAQSSGSTASDYTQVADVGSPPYTDTGLEDGERYYYRVSAYN